MANDSLHTRLLTTPTPGFGLLSILHPEFPHDPWKFIHATVDNYNEAIRNNTADEPMHSAYHAILCYQYQLLFKRNIASTSDYSNADILVNLRKSLFTSDANAAVDQRILHEISVLQIVLYLDIEKSEFQQLFTEAVEFIRNQPDVRTNLPTNYAIIDTFLDSAILINKLSTKTGISVFIPAEFFIIIEVWFYAIDEHNSQEWTPFVSLVLKKIAANPPVLPQLWALIKDYSAHHTNSKSLALLYGIIDDLLSQSSAEAVSLNITNCMDEKILLLISDHLVSNIQQYRKQAQVLLKKLVDHLKKHSTNISKEERGHLLPPFVFGEDADSVEEMEDNFFLLLETLEEERADLHLPAISLLEALVETSISQQSSLNKLWLRCLFTRLLTLDNKAVVKEGLISLLQMHLQMFDDGFMSLLVRTLNNTFLYEDPSPEPHPAVLRELSIVYFNAEQSKVNFTSKVIIAASRVNWAPIPLFYLFESLGNSGIAEFEHNIWAAEELTALIRITRQTAQQIGTLRYPTQINVIKCILNYVKPPLDPALLGSVFSLIDRKEVLVRGNSNWKSLVEYLKENLYDYWAPERSVCEVAEHLLTDAIHIHDMYALGILSVLIYDGDNVLLKAAITSNVLCPLLSRITGPYERSCADTVRRLEALELMVCLLDLSPQHEDSYIMLILGFSGSIFDYIIKSFWNHWPLSYEEVSVHIKALAAIRGMRDLSDNIQGAIDQVLYIAEEDLDNIGNLIVSKDTPVLRAWYALSILYWTNTGYGIKFKKPVPEFLVTEENKIVVSECYGLVAKLYQCYVECELLSDAAINELFPRLKVLADTDSDQAMAPILKILAILFGHDINKADWCLVTEEIIDMCWRHIWDMERTAEFWEAADELVALLLCEVFLRWDRLEQFALNKVDDILFRTDNTSGLRFMLFKQMRLLPAKTQLIFCDSVVQAFLQIRDEQQERKVELQTCYYIMKEYELQIEEDWTVQTGLGMYMDSVTRAVLVALILQMHRERPEEAGRLIIPQLTSMLENLGDEKYSENSNTHRVKHRIMQVLLLIHGTTLEDYIGRSIANDSDQRSVTLMKEWILVLTYLRNPAMKQLVWKFFPVAEEGGEAEGLLSLVSVVYHVARGSQDDRLAYMKSAVARILPHCFSRLVSVRWYSQVVLHEFFKANKSDYKVLRRSIKHSIRRRSAGNTPVKALDYFYLKEFNPEANWTLQTIFYEFPRLTNVCMDEWIDPDIFAKFFEGEEYEEGVKIYDEEENLGNIGSPQEWNICDPDEGDDDV